MPFVLKEAFQYKNVLDSHFNLIKRHLACSSSPVGMLTTELHLLKKANPEAEDELREERQQGDFDYPVTILAQFMIDIVNEIRDLNVAIEKAKVGTFVDSDIASNSYIRSMATVLRKLGSAKSTEKKTRETAFKFNADGNQVGYCYDVIVTTKPDYPTHLMRNMSRRYFEQSNDTSTKIDRVLIDTIVDFSPSFNMTDSVEEALESYVCKLPEEQADGQA